MGAWVGKLTPDVLILDRRLLILFTVNSKTKSEKLVAGRKVDFLATNKPRLTTFLICENLGFLKKKNVSTCPMAKSFR